MNVWIDKSGGVWGVEDSRHAVENALHGKRRGYCIRVSMPERRRRHVGIEVLSDAPLAARKACKAIVRTLRSEGYDIVADVGGKVVECYQHQRPTSLNHKLSAED